MVFRQRHVFVLLGVLILLLAVAGPAFATEPVLVPKETRITTSTGGGSDPAISGDIITYTRDGGSGTDVYYYDLATGLEHQVTNRLGNQELPAVWNRRIAYADSLSHDVWLYDIGTSAETKISREGWNPGSLDPALGESLVAWGESDNSIVGFDLGTGEYRRTTTSPFLNFNVEPAVSGSVIVWSAGTEGLKDIVAYDWTTGVTTTLTVTPLESERSPDIDGSKVVYEIRSAVAGSDIGMYDLVTGTERRLSLPGYMTNPSISGNYVAFEDWTGGTPHLFVWDLATGQVFPTTTPGGGQFLNDIDGDRIVYTSDRDGRRDIYMIEFQVVTPPDITVSPSGEIPFGDVKVGESKTTWVTIENTGQDAVDVTCTLDPAPEGVVLGEPAPRFQIQPGTSVNVPVTFTPAVEGPISGALLVETTAPGMESTTVPISGESRPPGPADHPPFARAGGPYYLSRMNDVLNPAYLTLDGRASFDADPGDSIVEYAWDLDNDLRFDDAYGATVSLPVYTYAWQNGTAVPICLRVTDSAGQQTESSYAYILTTMNPRPFVGPGGADPYVRGLWAYLVQAGSDVRLDASGSYNADNHELRYEWDLNADGTVDAYGPTPVVSWSTLSALGVPTDPGSLWRMQLRVVDAVDGVSNEANVYMCVDRWWFEPAPDEPAVTFPDPKLEAAVRAALAKPLGDILPVDMLLLTRLDAAGCGITNLGGLESAQNLAWLNVGGNQITDISPVAGLTDLESLFLYNNRITDLSPVSGLTKLVTLWAQDNLVTSLPSMASLESLSSVDLSRNRLTSITPVADLDALASLSLNGNQVEDLSPLGQAEALTSLYVDENMVATIGPLSEVTSLTRLSVASNRLSALPETMPPNLTWFAANMNTIADLSPVAKLSGLTYLDVYSNRVADLTPIAGLTKLDYLQLYGNEISDVSPLAGLTALRNLTLSSNHISDISPLSGLSELVFLDIHLNRIRDVSPLTDLLKLRQLNASDIDLVDISPLLTNSAQGGLGAGDYVSLEKNYLDLAEGSDDMTAIQALILAGAEVSYLPQYPMPSTALTTSPAGPDGVNDWYVSPATVTLSASGGRETCSVYYKWDDPSGAWTKAGSDPIAVPEGSHTLYYRSVDSLGMEEETRTAVIKVDTAHPAAPELEPLAIYVGSPLTLTGSAEPNAVLSLVVTDSDGHTVTGEVTASASGAFSSTLDVSALSEGSLAVRVAAKDDAGNASDSAQTATTKDTAAPSAPTIGSVTGSVTEENMTAAAISGVAEPGSTVAVTVTDGTHEVTASVTAGADGAFAATLDLTPLDDGAITYRIKAADAAGNTSAEVSTQATKETSAPPVLGAVAVDANVVPISSTVGASASLSDPNAADGHTGTWDWGDGSTSPATIDEAGGTGTATGSHTYTQPGVYSVTLSLSDSSGLSDSETFTYVVAYDPSAGFVTGGGWFQSPLGAMPAEPTAFGRATFGFVSRYKKGASTPSGQTEFCFSAGGLQFESDTYEWLVVAGARAQYKGSGTVNGGGDYCFILTAVDGQLVSGGSRDRLRMKIWDKATGDLVYDNQSGAGDDSAPATAIGGGSIVIHK